MQLPLMLTAPTKQSVTPSTPPAGFYPSLCLVTEWYPGRPLSAYYSHPQYAAGLPLAELLHIGLSLLSTLCSLHSAHILHCDVTQNNVLYDAETQTTCLIDFGLSKLLVRGIGDQDAETRADHFEGTLAFASPEQTGRINRRMDYRTDLYSVGVLLYQMATGRLPFISGTARRA